MREIKIIVEEIFTNDNEETKAIQFNKIMENVLQKELNKIEFDVEKYH